MMSHVVAARTCLTQGLPIPFVCGSAGLARRGIWAGNGSERYVLSPAFHGARRSPQTGGAGGEPGDRPASPFRAWSLTR